MFEMSLLVALFSQLSPYGVVAAGPQAKPTQIQAYGIPANPLNLAQDQKHDFRLIVEFPQINGLKPGSPVLVKGNLVGRVDKIAPQASAKKGRATKSQAAAKKFEVSLQLDAKLQSQLSLGTCALQSQPMTDSKSSRKPVVELFVPTQKEDLTKLALLRSGDKIQGYSSFEEFWRSGTRTAASPAKKRS